MGSDVYQDLFGEGRFTGKGLLQLGERLGWTALPRHNCSVIPLQPVG